MKSYKLLTEDGEERHFINKELAEEARKEWCNTWYVDFGYSTPEELMDANLANIEEIDVEG